MSWAYSLAYIPTPSSLHSGMQGMAQGYINERTTDYHSLKSRLMGQGISSSVPTILMC